jgi:predicted murein hydrolase (TIGR00659 family)
MDKSLIAITIIALTVVTYLCMTKLYVRFPFPIFIPIITTAILFIAFLICLHISYDTYMIGGKWINMLLGPAVVALAYPLYNQRHILLKHIYPIITGVFIGLMTGMLSGLLLAVWFGMDKSIILSLIPKSITTPVAIDIASELGGIPSLTVVFVMIAGFVGVTIGPMFLNWFRIYSELSKGIALGSASHAIGTSKAAEYGEISFSMGSISMALTAVLGAILGPFIPWLFHILNF